MEVTFADVLASLQAWLGRSVRADIEVPGPSLLAHFRGVLTHGHDLGMLLRPRSQNAALYFSLADTEGGFLLDPASFKTARRFAGDRGLRVEQTGSITFKGANVTKTSSLDLVRRAPRNEALVLGKQGSPQPWKYNRVHAD